MLLLQQLYPLVRAYIKCICRVREQIPSNVLVWNAQRKERKIVQNEFHENVI